MQQISATPAFVLLFARAGQDHGRAAAAPGAEAAEDCAAGGRHPGNRRSGGTGRTAAQAHRGKADTGGNPVAALYYIYFYCGYLQVRLVWAPVYLLWRLDVRLPGICFLPSGLLPWATEPVLFVLTQSVATVGTLVHNAAHTTQHGCPQMV